MLKALLPVMFLLLLSCAGWQKGAMDGLKAAEYAVKAVDKAGELIRERCREIALDCADSGDKICKDLVACHVRERQVAFGTELAYHALGDAYLAVAMSSERDSGAALAKLINLVGQVQAHVKEAMR